MRLDAKPSLNLSVHGVYVSYQDEPVGWLGVPSNLPEGTDKQEFVLALWKYLEAFEFKVEK